MADDRQPPEPPEPPEPDEPSEPDEPTEIRPGDPGKVGPGDAGPPRWSGRAQIPPAGGLEVREAAPPDAWPDEEAGRKWWAPIAIGLVAMALLAALAAGIWLIARSGSQPVPTPVPTPSASPAPAPTTAAPITTAPATTAPALVAVPRIVGLSLPDAQDLLRNRGLTAQVEQRVDSGATPGTVLATVPPAGTMVAPGSAVRVIVAAAPPTSAPPTWTPAATTRAPR